MEYRHSVVVELPYDDAVHRVRAALAAQGFGVLTEIDVTAVLKAKQGVDMEPYVILGACNPDLAHRALELDRGIGALLPCNVVVSGNQDGGSTVSILDPQLMASVTGIAGLQPIADEASRRLQLVLETIAGR